MARGAGERERRQLAGLVCASERLSERETGLLVQLLESARPAHRAIVAANLPYNARNRSIELVGQFGDRVPGAVLEVIGELTTDDLLTTRIAAEALVPAARQALATAVPLLERLAANDYPAAREAVAASLAELAGVESPALLAALLRWSSSPNRSLRELAARGLAHFGARAGSPALGPLAALAGDEFAAVRAWSVLALAPLVTAEGGPALAALVARAGDVRWSVRVRVAQALPLVPEEGLMHALRLLAGLALDLIPGVAQEAMAGLRALARTRPLDCLDVLRRLAQDGSLIDVDTLLILVSTLREVGTAEPEAARRILRRLLGDPDGQVRARARQALRSLAGGAEGPAPESA